VFYKVQGALLLQETNCLFAPKVRFERLESEEKTISSRKSHAKNPYFLINFPKNKEIRDLAEKNQCY